LIRSFRNSFTQAIANGSIKKGFPADLVRVAQRKLTRLSNASVLDDLRFPPGNRLEKLSGDREGQHSIRINDQFRICFRWTEAGPEEVDVTDYH